MVDKTRGVAKEAVGRLTVAFSPELLYATVYKPGLLVPEVVKDFDGPGAYARAQEWAESNQDAADA